MLNGSVTSKRVGPSQKTLDATRVWLVGVNGNAERSTGDAKSSTSENFSLRSTFSFFEAPRGETPSSTPIFVAFRHKDTITYPLEVLWARGLCAGRHWCAYRNTYVGFTSTWSIHVGGGGCGKIKSGKKGPS